MGWESKRLGPLELRPLSENKSVIDNLKLRSEKIL